jgi:hypothetical protein
MRPNRGNLLGRKRPEFPGLPGLTRGPWEADRSVCPGKVWQGRSGWRSAGATLPGKPAPGRSVLNERVEKPLFCLKAAVLAVGAATLGA